MFLEGSGLARASPGHNLEEFIGVEMEKRVICHQFLVFIYVLQYIMHFAGGYKMCLAYRRSILL